LGSILDALQDDGAINYYDPDDLEMLANGILLLLLILFLRVCVCPN
jgi:hypothetical protein